MTTIAWDGDTVAADTLATLGKLRGGLPKQKLVCTGELVFAICGLGAMFEAWINWYRAGQDPHSPILPVYKGNDINEVGNFIVFYLDDGPRMFSYEVPYPTLCGAPESWGSGGDIAKGAMRWGAKAEQAIACAKIDDPYTGGAIEGFRRSNGVWTPLHALSLVTA